MDDKDKPGLFKNRPTYLIILSMTFISLIFYVALQSESITKAIRMRLYTSASDHVIYKEELKEITNQAVAEITNAADNGITSIDNKADMVSNEIVAEQKEEKVSKEILREINKARRETR